MSDNQRHADIGDVVEDDDDVLYDFYRLGEPIRTSFPTLQVPRGGIRYIRPGCPLVPIPRQVVLFPRWDAAIARLGRVRRWPLRVRYGLAERLYRLAVRLDDDLAPDESEWA